MLKLPSVGGFGVKTVPVVIVYEPLAVALNATVPATTPIAVATGVSRLKYMFPKSYTYWLAPTVSLKAVKVKFTRVSLAYKPVVWYPRPDPIGDYALDVGSIKSPARKAGADRNIEIDRARVHRRARGRRAFLVGLRTGREARADGSAAAAAPKPISPSETRFMVFTFGT